MEVEGDRIEERYVLGIIDSHAAVMGRKMLKLKPSIKRPIRFFMDRWKLPQENPPGSKALTFETKGVRVGLLPATVKRRFEKFSGDRLL
jgi:hypothetical protein